MRNAESPREENLDTQSGFTETSSGSAQKDAGVFSSRKSSRRIARVGKHWKNKPAIIKRDDGREICNRRSLEGLNVYADRVFAMLKRQKNLCCNCKMRLDWTEATFEHENGRGAGKQDDRIWIGNKPINGASHLICNQKRGSSRSPIWHGENE